ncbi:MAG TPA: malectin domain-containing carbohydrate-binding protein [Candidatus Sulfotelmatobacter sp.]|nr:malectin domain-containing carbohydrate-binding protein [Candidatus Sulfotelmatobacter sp.]
MSGHVYDSQGNGLSDQQVILKAGSTNIQTTTDSSGNYSLQAVPGTYTIVVVYPSDGSSTLTTVPESYQFQASNYSLTQNTSLNITFPEEQVTVHVQDSMGNPISGAGIQVPQTNVTGLSIGGGITNASGDSFYGVNGYPKPTTDSSGNITLYLFPNSSSNPYTITASPPSGSNYTTTSLTHLVITSNASETITMTQPVVLSGHVYDTQGNVLSDQLVSLSNSNNTVQTTTDSSGSYSLNLTSGTNYKLTVVYPSDGSSTLTTVPESYQFQSSNYSISQNTTLNITVPEDTVSLHVQDTAGNPISNVKIQIPQVNVSGLSIGGGITNASGDSFYGVGGYPQPQTDANGNLTLYLFPNSSNAPYTITATPPSGSPYSQFTLQHIVITGNQSELISLQYNHATPTTTATLSPISFSDGTYSDPTTVTLSATAASGYTVANTYYTVDGGTQQTYSAPFNVTGSGSHTIKYWSVDNSGAQEASHTKTFTITESYNLTGIVYVDANQNGVQDNGEQGYAGATVTLNTGQTATTDSNGNYTFSHLETGTYVETLTVPNGYTATTTNPANIALAANTTQNFGIIQANSLATAINAGGSNTGNFVADTDYSDGTTYTSSATVDTSSVSNPAPQAVYQSVRYGNFTYTIPNLTANGTYTVRLHFNELYWNAAGQRIFNVAINGTQVLNNFDIYQTAGGQNKAIVEQFPATTDSNGNISINFTTVTDNAMVNGIEVYNGTLQSPTPTLTPTPATTAFINAGGSASGNFIADADYTGGTTYSSTASVDTSGVTSPAPQAVYQNVRYGNFTYTVPNLTPSTNYLVRLHFNELYWGTPLTGNSGGVGSRVFNVAINGTQVLNNFDIYQTVGGANKAVVEEFTEPTDSQGRMTIQFSTVTDNAMVNGIELIQQ